MGSCLSVDGDSSYPSSPSSVSGYQKVGKNSRKRHGIGNSSFDSKRETQLHKVSGRMVANGANTVASLFTQQGKKGTNQDAMIVWENFGSRTDTVFCGVFDGHGPLGHMVARRVRDSLPLKLSAHWEINISQDSGMKQSSSRAGSMNPAEISSLLLEKEVRSPTDIEEKENHPDIFLTLKQSFLKAFKVMDKELKVHPHIDCFCSGTTAVTLVKQGQDLVIGNVGDSRAIIGSRDQDDCLVAIQLTVDLKPNLPREAERIRKCKGRVFALQDEPEVARIWLPNYDSPGLAMARAFGDFCLKDFGLISVPEVSYRHLSEKDEFVVLATDGIWDVLSNKEVVDIVASAPARACAARALVETAVRAWRFKYPTSKVDDCAVVCLFLDSSPNSFSTATNKKKEHQSIEESNMESGEMQQNSGSLPTLEESEITQQEESDSDLKGGGEEWSALEGVARVNTLLTLPRFVPSENDKRLKK